MEIQSKMAFFDALTLPNPLLVNKKQDDAGKQQQQFDIVRNS